MKRPGRTRERRRERPYASLSLSLSLYICIYVYIYIYIYNYIYVYIYIYIYTYRRSVCPPIPLRARVPARVRFPLLGRIPKRQTNLFNSGTNSKIGTSRVQVVLGVSSRWELKAINTRSVCPLGIRQRSRVQGLGLVIDYGRGATRADDAQGTPTQSQISPSTYPESNITNPQH